MSDSHEVNYLAELMADFPGSDRLTVDNALRQLQFRYELLLDRATAPTTKLPDFTPLPTQLHYILYQGVLGNAGKYRQLTDPKQGVVYFGPNQKFRGSDPTVIGAEVDAITATLVADDATPVNTIVAFYQRFVQIHHSSFVILEE